MLFSAILSSNNTGFMHISSFPVDFYIDILLSFNTLQDVKERTFNNFYFGNRIFLFGTHNL
jgi:hypothetical protein